MNLAFDCETSGLPLENPRNRWIYSDPKIPRNYDSCRLVSISWILARGSEVVQQSYYLVKPKDFLISPESQKIHGISQEKAETEGIDIQEVLNSFNQALLESDNLIAHNVYFDINVIKSELYRENQEDKAALMDSKRHSCTMKLGKEFMNFYKNPSLSELYQHCYQIPAKNLHNAMADTFYCWKCYLHMVPQEPNVYFIKNKKINLSDQQKAVVHTDLNRNILVVASAGSGKTLTIAIRIKHLIDSGIDSGEIMLTTFTKDASYDMKSKLLNVLGYQSNVKIGTIDSICREFCRDLKLKNVSQFCIEYLEWIKNNPHYLKRWRYLFIDEYQDINTDQFNIIYQFYSAGVNIFAVGDDCQNIYTFRGSKLDYFLNFTSQFHNSLQLQLTKNFRNALPIMNFANQIIKSIDQIPKIMISTDLPTSAIKTPRFYSFSNYSEQSEKILDKITKKYFQKLDEIVILAPQSYHLYYIEETLAKHGINTVLLDKTLPRGQTRRSDAVCLATIHKSKGLEWDHVFIIGIGDHDFPKQKDETSVKEGRRLFYVAATRARISLDIMYTFHPNGPTRYIGEISQELWHSTERVNFPEISSEPNAHKKKTIQIEKMVSILNNHQWNIITNFTKNLYDCFASMPCDLKFQSSAQFQTSNLDFQYPFPIFLKTLVIRETLHDTITTDSAPFSAISDLDNDFKQKYISSAAKYSDSSTSWTDIISDIWNVAVLKQVFADRRRKLLYHQPVYDDFLADQTWQDYLRGIISGVKPYLGKKNSYHLVLQYQFSTHRIWDNIDIISDKSLILFKTETTNSDLKLEWIVQIITQKLLCDINQIPIDLLVVINLFDGRSWTLKSEFLEDFEVEKWFSIFLASL